MCHCINHWSSLASLPRRGTSTVCACLRACVCFGNGQCCWCTVADVLTIALASGLHLASTAREKGFFFPFHLNTVVEFGEKQMHPDHFHSRLGIFFFCPISGRLESPAPCRFWNRMQVLWYSLLVFTRTWTPTSWLLSIHLTHGCGGHCVCRLGKTTLRFLLSSVVTLRPPTLPVDERKPRQQRRLMCQLWTKCHLLLLGGALPPSPPCPAPFPAY